MCYPVKVAALNHRKLHFLDLNTAESSVRGEGHREVWARKETSGVESMSTLPENLWEVFHQPLPGVMKHLPHAGDLCQPVFYLPSSVLAEFSRCFIVILCVCSSLWFDSISDSEVCDSSVCILRRYVDQMAARWFGGWHRRPASQPERPRFGFVCVLFRISTQSPNTCMFRWIGHYITLIGVSERVNSVCVCVLYRLG